LDFGSRPDIVARADDWQTGHGRGDAALARSLRGCTIPPSIDQNVTLGDRMRSSPSTLALLAGSALILASACGSAPSEADHTLALVEVFNLLPTSAYVSAGALDYFSTSGIFCFHVDPVSPGTVIVNADTRDRVLGSFTPSVQPASRNTVFIYQTANGSTQFVTASSAFAPKAGSAGVRFFNGSSIPEDLYVTDTLSNGEPVGSPVISGLGVGVASEYVNIPPGQHYVLATPVGLKARTFAWNAAPFEAGTNTTFGIPNYGGPQPPYGADCATASIGLPRP
jgi:hypothetical protein